MINMIKAEFIKERRSANAKLTFIVPIIFVIFNILMVSLMGKSPEGKSYIMATAFNWYPILILPIVLSLLVINTVTKEKDEHVGLQKSLNLSPGKILIAKNIVVICELFIILLISSIAIYFVGVVFLKDEILAGEIIMATACLFIGSIPVIALSFLLNKIFSKRFLVVLINFMLTLPSALIAATDNWKYFPWAYNLRILSPVIGVHPNGTFLDSTSPLMRMNAVYLGLGLSLTVYILVTVLNLVIERRKNNV